MSARRLEKRPNKGSGDNDGHVDVPKKKRETISTACTACQKRKSKVSPTNGLEVLSMSETLISNTV